MKLYYNLEEHHEGNNYNSIYVTFIGISTGSFQTADYRSSLGVCLRAKQRNSLSMSSSQSVTSSTLIDLRSDTVTTPSSSMRQRMLTTTGINYQYYVNMTSIVSSVHHVVGDDVFGEDPTINELESRVAEMFGKEGSLFFPSGTMSNLAAVMSWCGTRGSEMILGDTSHIHLFEQVMIYILILCIDEWLF